MHSSGAAPASSIWGDSVRRNIRRGVTWLITVLLISLVVVWWLNRDKGDPIPWEKPATVNGRSVELTYVGSECQDGSRVEADEDSERVVLTVFAWSNAWSCSDVGHPYTLKVTLSSDLGDHELVDGACEMAEFKRYVACRGEP
jgi:hypothetical protein